MRHFLPAAALTALALTSPIAVDARTKDAAMTVPAATRHATGTFTVTITPEGDTGTASPGDVPTGRMGLAKVFSGDLAGTAAGTMLTAGVPGPGAPAAYVAIDWFHGRLAGREGGFVLAHRGTIDKAGKAELSVIVTPDSGTGALAGIAGTLSIRAEGGVHRYDLAYTLPGD